MGHHVVEGPAAEEEVDSHADLTRVVHAAEGLVDRHQVGSVGAGRPGADHGVHGAARPGLALLLPPGLRRGGELARQIPQDFRRAADVAPVDADGRAVVLPVPARKAALELVADGLVVGRDDDEHRIALGPRRRRVFAAQGEGQGDDGGGQEHDDEIARTGGRHRVRTTTSFGSTRAVMCWS